MREQEFRRVVDYLEGLQGSICRSLEELDGSAEFFGEEFALEGTISRPRVMQGGEQIEKAAVNFSHSRGPCLPPAATARKPELVGKAFEVASLSLIVHPRNPYVPTTHANFRGFRAYCGEDVVWWFGGGFDLTPYYGFEEDARAWHATAKEACDGFEGDLYGRFKKECDDYFYLPHRKEARGIGGVFFDDFNELPFEESFAMVRSVGDAFMRAYGPIVERRKGLEYGERERDWQLLRRGRYVEFNLVYDRGTQYGLQSGRRTESVLCSMPPLVRWEYDHVPEAGSAEEKLLRDFLPARDWLKA